MTPYDRWLTTETVTLHNGRPTECDRCEGRMFTFHSNSRKRAHDHYKCTGCDAYYYINEVGA